MKNCKDLYLQLNNKLYCTIEETLVEENLVNHSISSNFVNDYEKWIDQLFTNNEAILYKYALLEYQHALLFVAQGLYRQAFNSLRFCLEHTCFGVYLSASEFNFRRWKAGQLDVYWSMITDENTGIFSKIFIEMFSSEFSDKSTELRELAKMVYRECSEFTHGNYKVTSLIPESIRYEEALFNLWQDKADTIRYLITMIFFIRYYDKIKVKTVAVELESSIMEYIGTITQVQVFYDIIKKEE